MAKKNIPVPQVVMPPYEGQVNERYLAAAKQSSAFLNDVGEGVGEMDGMMKEMMIKDLRATAIFAQYNVNGAVANQIRDEAKRFVDENEVNTWF